MKISEFNSLPNDAREIRKAVFMREQGFQNEFDEIDDRAVHIVLYDKKTPVAACRVFWDSSRNAYVLGRLAVVKEYRGRHIGSAVIEAAEKYVHKNGGNIIILHAQCRAADFYKRSGFVEFGDVEDDEGCPHIWMKKTL